MSQSLVMHVLSVFFYLSSLFLFTIKFANSKLGFNRQQANETAHNLVDIAALLANPTFYTNVLRCIEKIIINKML